MGTLIITALVILLTLTAIAHVSSRSSRGGGSSQADKLTLLPGDISYESPSGNFKFYFPVTTSIVLSIVLTVIMRFLS